MQYFFVLISSGTQTKNKLQKEIYNYIKALDRKVLTQENVEEFKQNVLDYIATANATYKNCTPVQTSWSHYSEWNYEKLYLEFVQITIYKAIA